MFELIYDNLKKPINVGVVIRLACATGSRIYFSGDSVDYRNKKALLAAVGYQELADINYFKDYKGLVGRLKSEGKVIVGTSPRTDKIYTDLDYKKPTVFVFGTEASGLSREKLSMLDEVVKIPMPGQIESLNVVTASAIILYEGLRQRGFVI